MLRPHRGRMPAVHPTAYVDQSAQLIGDVAIGPEASVWMCAVLRGDVNRIRLGARSNVQDGTIIHGMPGIGATDIGADVTIGHGAIVHGCRIADRVLIGMGAIVLTGAEIGPDAIVGAGALVPEGMVVPPRTLVKGRPARVARTLTGAEVASILEFAASYVTYRRDYATDGPTA